jgi:hypothetical protein
MTSENNKRSVRSKRAQTVKRTIAEKMIVAEQLRDLQRALAPLRAANRAKRAAGKVEIRIKTK